MIHYRVNFFLSPPPATLTFPSSICYVRVSSSFIILCTDKQMHIIYLNDLRARKIIDISRYSERLFHTLYFLCSSFFKFLFQFRHSTNNSSPTYTINSLLCPFGKANRSCREYLLTEKSIRSTFIGYCEYLCYKYRWNAVGSGVKRCLMTVIIIFHPFVYESLHFTLAKFSFHLSTTSNGHRSTNHPNGRIHESRFTSNHHSSSPTVSELVR